MADLESQLHQVKLKSVKTNSSTTATTTNLANICENENDYDKILNDVSFEEYYPHIKDYSMLSHMFEFSAEEVERLVFHGAQFLLFAKEQWEATHSNEFRKEYKEWLNDPILQQLCMRVEQGMSQVNSPQGVFVRTNIMSPKDAITNRPSFGKQVLDALVKVKEIEAKFQDVYGKEQGSFQTEDNRRIYAVYIASIAGLIVKKGEDAVQLFVESGRAQQVFKSTQKGFPVSLIIRQWCNFDVAFEFRAFFYNKKLTGITQYNPYAYFPNIKHDKAKWEKMMVDFCNSFDSSKVTMQHFIADLIIVNENEVKIVELNPFAEFAGSCMFEWHKPADRDILVGKKPFEFRIVEQAPKYVMHQLEEKWKVHMYPEKNSKQE